LHRNGDLLVIKLLQLTTSAPLIASRYGFLPHIDACVAKKYPFLVCLHTAMGQQGARQHAQNRAAAGFVRKARRRRVVGATGRLAGGGPHDLSDPATASLGQKNGDFARVQTRMTAAGVTGRSTNPPGMATLSQVRSAAVDSTVAVRYRLHQRLLLTGPVV
jgi:hypothetical protein